METETNLAQDVEHLNRRATEAQALAWRAAEYNRQHPDAGEWARLWSEQTDAEARRLTDLAQQAARVLHGDA